MFTKYKFFIFSEDPDTLVKFYTDILGWEIIHKLEYELDYGYMLEISKGGMQVWIAKHSLVSGKNKDPYRHLLNLYTDKVVDFYNKAKDYPLVKIVAKPFSMGEIIPGETRMCTTILDPEGNCLQFMEDKNHGQK